jgi:hypothetical protein
MHGAEPKGARTPTRRYRADTEAGPAERWLATSHLADFEDSGGGPEPAAIRHRTGRRRLSRHGKGLAGAGSRRATPASLSARRTISVSGTASRRAWSESCRTSVAAAAGGAARPVGGTRSAPPQRLEPGGLTCRYPWASSSAYASRATPRETPSCVAIWREAGSADAGTQRTLGDRVAQRAFKAGAQRLARQALQRPRAGLIKPHVRGLAIGPAVSETTA